jgi:hypothetical protein
MVGKPRVWTKLAIHILVLEIPALALNHCASNRNPLHLIERDLNGRTGRIAFHRGDSYAPDRLGIFKLPLICSYCPSVYPAASDQSSISAAFLAVFPVQEKAVPSP